MYKLTPKREEAARDILERYRTELYKRGDINTNIFEKELRDCWDGMWYQQVKDIAIDMVKNHPRYKYLAAYYMQFSGATGVVSEFQQPLAELYEDLRFDGPEAKEPSNAFWKRFNSDEARNLRQQIDSQRGPEDSESELSGPHAAKVQRLQDKLQELTGEEY